MVCASAYTRNQNQAGGGYNYNSTEILGFANIRGWIMSGVSALMKLGLFSLRGTCSKEPGYEITTPEFDGITIKPDPRYYPGREFRIVTHDNTPDNVYIQKAKKASKLQMSPMRNLLSAPPKLTLMPTRQAIAAMVPIWRTPHRPAVPRIRSVLPDQHVDQAPGGGGPGDHGRHSGNAKSAHRMLDASKTSKRTSGWAGASAQRFHFA